MVDKTITILRDKTLVSKNSIKCVGLVQSGPHYRLAMIWC